MQSTDSKSTRKNSGPNKSSDNRKAVPDYNEPLLPPLYTRRDVATLLSCCTETVKRYERRGLLPALKINARVTRYEPAAVEGLIRNARVQTQRAQAACALNPHARGSNERTEN